MLRSVLTRTVRRARPLGVVFVALVVALTGSCSSSETSGPADPTQDPAQIAASNMEQCMKINGWEVRIEDGGLSAEVPDEQDEQFLRAHTECVEKFGYERPPQMTRQEAEEYYERLVTAGVCLRDHGYTAPDPASRQATVEDLMNGRLPSWNPYEGVLTNAISGDELDSAYEACPPPWSKS